MNDISSLSNVVKTSGVQDGIQAKSNKKTDVTFKKLLNNAASDKSSLVKNSFDAKDNTASKSKDEDIKDNNLPVKLSGEELAKVKSFIEKLKNGFSNKADTSDNTAGAIEELNQMNLAQINEVLDILKGKDLSELNINNENQQLQINQAVINELNKMTKQISNVISFINNSKAKSNIQVSEDSINADKNDKNINELVLELYGMTSILSKVALIKVQSLQGAEDKEDTAAIESLRDIQMLNKSLGTTKELLENCINDSLENQNNYFKLGQTLESIISNNNSNADSKLNIYKLQKLHNASSELAKMLANNNEDLKVDSEVEKLINKFIGQAEELGQQLNNKSILKTAQLRDDRLADISEKLISGVKMKNLSENAIKPLEQSSKNSKTINEDSLNKEDKLLLKLSSDDKDSTKDDMNTKIARITNFTTSINADKNLPLEGNATPPVVNRQTFNNDFIKALKYMELNNVKELTVKVMPKELGELFVKITMEGEVVKAHITATNKEAYNVLNSNLADISNKLSEQNIKIHSFNVEIYNGDSNFFKQGSNNEHGNSQNKRKNSIRNLEVEDISNIEDTSNDLNNLNALA